MNSKGIEVNTTDLTSSLPLQHPAFPQHAAVNHILKLAIDAVDFYSVLVTTDPVSGVECKPIGYECGHTHKTTTSCWTIIEWRHFSHKPSRYDSLVTLSSQIIQFNR